MEELTAEEFAQRAFDYQLLTDIQVEQIWGEFGRRNVPVAEFSGLCLRRNLLTNFQIDKLLRGHRSGYYYGDWCVQYMVGAGTFARVYRGVHRRSGDVAAVKVLRTRHGQDPAITKQFMQEGEMGMTLRHANIVPIYEVCEDHGHQFMVMEFVEGRNLSEFIKVRRKFDPIQATQTAIDVAAGLAYAFGKGISHRDLKLSNVLITAHGRAKLVDFGLAALDDALADGDLESITNPRTIDYAGLERSTGVRKDDHRSDVYFLGCMYYHMLAGKAPLFETRDRTQRLSKTRFESVTPILEREPSLPVVVALIVHKAMDLNPDARYQSPGEMHAELQLALPRLQSGAAAQDDEKQANAALHAGPPKKVMVVESDSNLQDVFRNRLKQQGFRVLLLSDPARAFDRLQTNPKTADCVVLNTENLDLSALEAFNQLGADRQTQQLPAVLLLSQRHQDKFAQAASAPHRIVVQMPVRFNQVQLLLNQLLTAQPAGSDA